MKKIKCILALSLLFVSTGCSNFQHKKIESVNYETIKGEEIRMTTYEDGSERIENLSLINLGNEKKEWNEG